MVAVDDDSGARRVRVSVWSQGMDTSPCMWPPGRSEPGHRPLVSLLNFLGVNFHECKMGPIPKHQDICKEFAEKILVHTGPGRGRHHFPSDDSPFDIPGWFSQNPCVLSDRSSPAPSPHLFKPLMPFNANTLRPSGSPGSFS